CHFASTGRPALNRTVPPKIQCLQATNSSGSKNETPRASSLTYTQGRARSPLRAVLPTDQCRRALAARRPPTHPCVSLRARRRDVDPLCTFSCNIPPESEDSIVTGKAGRQKWLTRIVCKLFSEHLITS